MAEDIHYENQRIYCENNKLPLFSNRSCDHSYPWNTESDTYGVRQSLGDMLVERHGSEKGAFFVSSNSHILSCPSCGKSWCD